MSDEIKLDISAELVKKTDPKLAVDTRAAAEAKPIVIGTAAPAKK